MPAPALKRAENGVWYVRWTEGRRSQRVSTRSRSLDEAKAFFSEWLTLESTPRHTGHLNCREAWAVYPERDRPRHKSIWALHLEPFFGDILVHQVTQAKFNEYVKLRNGQGAAHGTIWTETSKLLASWRAAVEAEQMPMTAIPRIKRLAPPEPKERWLRAEEIERLFAAAEALRPDPARLSRVELFLWLGLETGARKDAIEKLRWSQIDFEHGSIDYIAGRKQTRKRRVVAAISDRLRPVLERAYREREGDLVFGYTTSISGPLTTAAKHAGVPAVTPHVLRHTIATHMLRNGVSLWAVAHVLGNSVAQVEKVYGKWALDQSKNAVNSWGARAPFGRTFQPTAADNDQHTPGEKAVVS